MNSPFFRKQTQLAEDIIEVTMAKKAVTWNLPNQIGFFTYQYAKLRMLEFYYDCIDYYIDRSDYEMCEMDTDSLYFALSTNDLDSAVKPEKRYEFYNNYHHWFPSPACDEHREQFVQAKCDREEWASQECCIRRLKDDKFTPGLFKVEWCGDGMVSLCSKTYICFGGNPDVTNKENKVCSKGLNKKLNQFTRDTFLDVLKQKKAGGGINRGFRASGNHIVSYEQERSALSYLYIKRKVLDDGVSTEPLDI